MILDTNKDLILDFARSHPLCVISTSVNDILESALVDFVITDNLEIIFNTYVSSRKYRNLSRNPKVSIVIGFGDLLKTLQYEGFAAEQEGHDEGRITGEYGESPGFFRKWKIKDMRYFKVTPTWIRLSDFSEYPPKTVEVEF